MMNICVLSHSFPTQKTIDFVFVEQLCKELADKDVNITIIAPQSITKCLMRNIPLAPTKGYILSNKGKKIPLYRPYWISLGNKIDFLKRNNRNSFNKAIDKTLRKLDQKFDLIYCHFWAQAVASLKYSLEYKIPQVVVAGEGVLTTQLEINKEVVESIKKNVKGVICVSSKSKNESISAGFAEEKQCIVIPNAINPNLFYKMDKIKSRQNLCINKEDFIVVFVGQFNERKGVNRLCEALKKLKNSHIKAMFIGTGSQMPTYENTIFVGTVNHEDLPLYLNCADIFVLPTNNEGCCNAIIEAMACGLPILSSDKEFNYDVLNKKNSILFDPNDIDGIANAINSLYSDKLKLSLLSNGSLIKAKELTIDERTNKIKEYLEFCISK